MYIYAQINSDGVCIAVSQLASIVEDDSLVPLSSTDNSVIGKIWNGSTWESAASLPELVKRHISVGAFFDRFGAAKYAILADQSPGVQALIKDASVRQYIDLDRGDLPAGLQMLVQAGHAIDTQAIVSAPVEPHELP